VAAAKIKVIELAKELGVTSKDLMVAAEEMGHKGVRAMSPLDSALANALRVKLGKGRDLPEAPKAQARTEAQNGRGRRCGRGRSRREKARLSVEEGQDRGRRGCRRQAGCDDREAETRWSRAGHRTATAVRTGAGARNRARAHRGCRTARARRSEAGYAARAAARSTRACRAE
jgi:hypothetical protein